MLHDFETEAERLMDVLASFPPDQRATVTGYLRQEAEHMRILEQRISQLPGEQRNRLRALVQEGIDSGPAREIDFEAIKQRGRERILAERRKEA
ncbi:MAG: hypothetical protein RhofKO_24990 [Rhodothermales bacterium]